MLLELGDHLYWSMDSAMHLYVFGQYALQHPLNLIEAELYYLIKPVYNCFRRLKFMTFPLDCLSLEMLSFSPLFSLSLFSFGNFLIPF